MDRCIEYEGWTFPADKIMSGNIYLASSLLADSLEVDSLFVEVECGDPSILDFQRNAPLRYYAKTDQPMVFRVQDIARTAPKRFEISATSTLGLLCEGQHYGGIYTGETAEEVIASICGTVPHIVKSSLKGIKLYGWLPIAAPRDNLAQVLFALGATLKTDLDGVLRIEGLWDGASRAIGPERMYLESAARYTSAVTDVSVTEHRYTEGSEEKQLFEGATLEGDIVTFDEPMHSLTAVGFKILDCGANWAKLSAGSGALSGKVYAHNTREIIRHIQDAAVQNVKTVKDATLISLVNSSAAANRLANYYQWRETVDVPAIYHGELPGDMVSGYHPFDRAEVGYCLQSADIDLSNTLKAQIQGLVGFVPPRVEDIEYRDTVEVILYDQEWTVPEGIDTILAVLIGGGGGGWNGREGKDGQGSTPGAGGAGGAGGDGGKIFQISADVTPGEKFQVKIGTGGLSGGYLAGFDIPPFVPGFGWNNGDTTFGGYTSASGASDPDGFLEVITQTVYARQGKTGEAGAAGGRSGEGSFVVGTIRNGEDGGSKVDPISGETYPGGSGASNLINATYGYYATGGGGGGAAVGGNGGNGTVGRITGSPGSYNCAGGSGGSGGSAKVPEKETVRGMGGTGGYGGGGGGGAGVGLNSAGAVGKGGDGSKGGTGADGAVIIYYGIKKEGPSGQFVDRNGRSILGRLQRRFIV